jgi:hypothetical protein
MKAQVTPEGLFIPKHLLEGIHEVEIRKEHDCLFIIPLTIENDPIFELGSSPVTTEEHDASEHHDQYLYQP